MNLSCMYVWYMHVSVLCGVCVCEGVCMCWGGKEGEGQRDQKINCILQIYVKSCQLFLNNKIKKNN